VALSSGIDLKPPFAPRPGDTQPICPSLTVRRARSLSLIDAASFRQIEKLPGCNHARIQRCRHRAPVFPGRSAAPVAGFTLMFFAAS
jgi:hypothetical protein